jgi:hypothetical protein
MPSGEARGEVVQLCKAGRGGSASIGCVGYVWRKRGEWCEAVRDVQVWEDRKGREVGKMGEVWKHVPAVLVGRMGPFVVLLWVMIAVCAFLCARVSRTPARWSRCRHLELEDW